MTSTSDVFESALTLPESERADLAHQLIASLEEPADDPAVVAEEWNAEIRRRLASVESGTTVGIPWAPA
ncbi:addiction module protein [Ornithinimicrobium faecis]|uniref:Addiction module protein n=1 Tax=Ornithinimicrobium faecis TaxID=2934158 RepID=A0ABY4YY37_9MICO|nr:MULTISPECIES: addiction module protein [unclassified Ornithinimicrobium]USQ81698.1 addiction module protein [Ornithinimicrobium sp. HY1793]